MKGVQRAMLERLGSDELLQRFLETLAEQTERHDGGGRWIGTGGHSPFGRGGVLLPPTEASTSRMCRSST